MWISILTCTGLSSASRNGCSERRSVHRWPAFCAQQLLSAGAARRSTELQKGTERPQKLRIRGVR
eukprot:6207293-Pleurochrysis_carterae.AAC.4